MQLGPDWVSTPLATNHVTIEYSDNKRQLIFFNRENPNLPKCEDEEEEDTTVTVVLWSVGIVAGILLLIGLIYAASIYWQKRKQAAASNTKIVKLQPEGFEMPSRSTLPARVDDT